ncbi:unnamed protein product [Camellia sinensis]
MPGTSTTTASSLKKIAASFLAPPPLQPPPSSCAQTDTLLAVLLGWFWFDSLTTFWISIYNSQGRLLCICISVLPNTGPPSLRSLIRNEKQSGNEGEEKC